MTPENIYVHAATLTEDSYHRIAATGGSVSVSTESEQSAGQGYPPTWRLRQHDIPVSLSMDTSVWWSGDLFSAMRATLGADRSREHLEAHAEQETVTNHHLRAEQVVDWATRGGSRALRLDSLVGSLEPGKKADVVLIKNDESPVMFPLLHPYGHVAFQAQRGDVHTVLVNGRVVKHEGRLVGIDLAYARQRSRRPSSSRSRARRGGVDEGHAPRDPGAPDPREPVPVHGLGRRLGAVEAGSLADIDSGGRRASTATRCGPTLRVGIRSARCDHAIPPCSRSGRRSRPGCCSRRRGRARDGGAATRSTTSRRPSRSASSTCSRCCSSRSCWGAVARASRRRSRSALAFNFFHIPPTGPVHDRRRRELGRARRLPRRRASSASSVAERRPRARRRGRAAPARGRPRRRDGAAAARRGRRSRRRSAAAAQRLAAGARAAVGRDRARAGRAATSGASRSRCATDDRSSARCSCPRDTPEAALRARCRSASCPRSRRCWPPRSSASALHARGRRDAALRRSDEHQDRAAARGLARPALAADRDRRRRRGARLADARRRRSARELGARDRRRGARGCRGWSTSCSTSRGCEAGAAEPRRDWCSVEEVIRAARRRRSAPARARSRSRSTATCR